MGFFLSYVDVTMKCTIRAETAPTVEESPMAPVSPDIGRSRSQPGIGRFAQNMSRFQSLSRIRLSAMTLLETRESPTKRKVPLVHLSPAVTKTRIVEQGSPGLVSEDFHRRAKVHQIN